MRINRKELIQKIENESLLEVTESLIELKSTWAQSYGKKICGIANHLSRNGGWLVVGISDAGKLLGKDAKWLTETERMVSSHIAQFLEPDFSVVNIKGENLEKGAILIIEIESPNEVVRWNDKPYKMIGTACSEMTQENVLDLTLKLPGSDFSKMEYQGNTDGPLIIEFAQKVEENGKFEEGFSVSNSTASQMLSKFVIENKKASGILFGDFKTRVVFYNEDDDILSKQEKSGLYSILRDDFVEEIQNWTRGKAQSSEKSLSITDEVPYPKKALREVLANAVAHAKYSKDQGGLLIEVYPSRITITNNCNMEAKYFVNKWFSKAHKTTNNLLMECLKMAGISDELGSGKRRIFRTMIERGKREPIVGFEEYGTYATWSITLYNEESNKNLLNLIERLKTNFPNADERRVATALVLWSNKNWDEIDECLDEHYKDIANRVVSSDMTPVSLINGKLYQKRWVTVALEGQVTRKFTVAEEIQLKSFLNEIAYTGTRQGYITFDEMRKFIGMSDTKTENSQLSRMFSKWAKDDPSFIASVPKKRGEWRLLKPPRSNGIKK
ncbi:MAG: hypothetical protein HOE90_01825 [Bacteriovoracaceae bacterium]|jgi:predicted HTH transcriptional regulator|nr:hypothetical protein [Bacteriovoracaceae bacterium]